MTDITICRDRDSGYYSNPDLVIAIMMTQNGRPRGGTTHVRCHPPAGFSGMPAVKAEPPFLSVEGGMAAEASAGGWCDASEVYIVVL